MNRFFFLIMIMVAPFSVFSQEADDWGFWESEPEIGDFVGPEEEFSASGSADTLPPENPETDNAAESAGSSANAPWGFGDLRLGMSMDEVKSVLSGSKDFSYRHFTESMLPYTELPVFECKGTKFIDRAVFQFYEDHLYSMTLFFNRRKIDFYTLFTTLTGQYGAHSELNPRRIVWENGSSQVTLLKPLTLSFLDAAVHRELLGKSEIRKDDEYMQKQEFLRQFGPAGGENEDLQSDMNGRSDSSSGSETEAPDAVS